jgi:hypothetical protein
MSQQCTAYISSLISLIVFIIAFFFDIYSSSLLFKAFVVESMAFEGELLAYCVMFLHWDLCIWGHFWLEVPIPCIPFFCRGGFLKDYLGLGNDWVVVFSYL